MSISQIKPSFIKSKKTIIGILKSILGFIGIFLAAEIIFQISALAICTPLGIKISGDDVPSNLLTETITYYAGIFYILVAIMYCKLIEKRSAQSMGFVKKGFVLKYIKGFIIGTILLSMVIIISLAAGALTYDGISKNISGAAVLWLLVSFIVQGMGEEVMCRGYLMTSLSKKTSMFWAVFLSSLFFALPHLQNLFSSDTKFGVIGFINTMLVSILFSLIMIKEKNIWLVSAIHTSWNFILGVFYGINVSSIETRTSILNFTVNGSKGLINGGKYGVEAGVATTVILIIAIGVMRLSMKTLQGGTVSIEQGEF